MSVSGTCRVENRQTDRRTDRPRHVTQNVVIYNIITQRVEWCTLNVHSHLLCFISDSKPQLLALPVTNALQSLLRYGLHCRSNSNYFGKYPLRIIGTNSSNSNFIRDKAGNITMVSLTSLLVYKASEPEPRYCLHRFQILVSAWLLLET